MLCTSANRLKTTMKVLIALITLLSLSGLCSEAVPSQNLGSSASMEDESNAVTVLQRQKRTFFSQIIFENTECIFDEFRNGTCMEAGDCEEAKGLRGSFSTGCNQPSGIAVCCVVQPKCGEVLVDDMNNTLYVNPDFPLNTTTPITCDLTVPTEESCYVRLDFVQFSLYPPVEGTCLVDQFFIPELTRNVPMLCGENTGTHMYLDVRDNERITLRTNLGEWGGPRIWQIKVTKIFCGTEAEPPTGCLQFYKEPNGLIQSFNFHHLNPNSSSLLAGLEYTICIQRAGSKCYTSWSAPFFAMTPYNETDGAIQGDSCNGKSMVIINEGYDISRQDITYDRFCGHVFSAVPGARNSTFVYTSAPPFHVRVRTARNNLNTTLGKGFKLRYRQLQCLDPPHDAFRSAAAAWSMLTGFFG